MAGRSIGLHRSLFPCGRRSRALRALSAGLSEAKSLQNSQSRIPEIDETRKPYRISPTCTAALGLALGGCALKAWNANTSSVPGATNNCAAMYPYRSLEKLGAVLLYVYYRVSTGGLDVTCTCCNSDTNFQFSAAGRPLPLPLRLHGAVHPIIKP